MTNSLKRLCVLLVVFFLCSCQQREQLAPVVDLHGRDINRSAKRHVVRRGETLYAIAFRYDQDYRKLAATNHLSSPYTVRIGQVLILQPGYLPAASNVQVRSINTSAATTKFQKPVWHRTQPAAIPFRSRPQSNTGWLWPVRGRVVATYVPQQGKKGIDIAGRKGDKIHAAASGVVAYAGSGLAGYGNLIIIKHNNQFLTAYGNNLRNLVKEGQMIKAGQIIAEMGVVDRRFWGVHFEIRNAGKPVNPLNYLQRA